MDLDNRLGVVILVIVAIVGVITLVNSMIPGGIMGLIG